MQVTNFVINFCLTELFVSLLSEYSTGFKFKKICLFKKWLNYT